MAKEQIHGLGIIPPQAIDMEECILGAILIESGVFPIVSALLPIEAFYKEAHQRIFMACTELYSKSEPIDLLTATSTLIASKQLMNIGGGDYLVELTSRVNSAANIEFHCRVVLEMWMRRLLISVSTTNQKNAFDLSCDIFKTLEKSQIELIKLVDRISKKKSETIGSKMSEVIENVERIVASRKSGTPISSGLLTGSRDYDDLTGGKCPSDLIILAARPGAGKTAKMLSEAREIVLSGTPTLIFSMEMSTYQLALRLLSIETGVTNSNIRRGNLAYSEIQRAKKVVAEWESKGLYIDDSSAVPISEMRSKIIMAYKKHGVRKVYIDYIQLAVGEGGNREQQVGSVSRGLKSIAKELNIPITALAQLSRDVEKRGGNKRPQLSDLRESGSLEQDADLVVFLYRPDYYGTSEFEDGSDARNKLMQIIAKHRNGACDEVMEYCDISCGRIGNKWINEAPISYRPITTDSKDFSVPQKEEIDPF